MFNLDVKIHLIYLSEGIFIVDFYCLMSVDDRIKSQVLLYSIIMEISLKIINFYNRVKLCVYRSCIKEIYQPLVEIPPQ